MTGWADVRGALGAEDDVPVGLQSLHSTVRLEAASGTVRGDFSISKQNNLVHGSDSPESSAREIALWFRPEELVDYELAGSQWVFGGA